MDGPQRRNSGQKAWTQGTNPITQRSTNAPQPNGVVSASRNVPKMTASQPIETIVPDKLTNDRLLFLLSNIKGRTATITVKNGACFVGIFSGSSGANEDNWLLKMVRRKTDDGRNQTNGVTPVYVGQGPEHVMAFAVKDIVQIVVERVPLGETTPVKDQNGIPSKGRPGFQTDADISGRPNFRDRKLQRWEPPAETEPRDQNGSGAKRGPRERKLQRWEPPTDADLLSGLEESGPGKAGRARPGQAWDQFATNERLTGFKSEFDENLYTTYLDRSDPAYKQREVEAARLAHEIESSHAMNAHVAEERGQALPDDGGADDEAKYSGVQRASVGGEPSTTALANPSARGVPGVAPAVTANPHEAPAIVTESARADAQPQKPAEPKSRNSVMSNVTPAAAAAPREGRAVAMPADMTPKPRLLPNASVTAKVPSKATSGVNAKPPASLLHPSATTAITPYAKAPGESATATVENDVLDSFKHFASAEKLRVMERRRNQMKHDKDIRLNDLMKFSQNFKLNTPVPRDLVPILAKDKRKQDEIMQRAQANFEANQSSSSGGGGGHKPLATLVDASKAPKPAPPTGGRNTDAHANARPNQVLLERLNFPPRGGRPGPSGPGASNNNNNNNAQPPVRPQTNSTMLPGRPGPGLSQRLTNVHQFHRGAGPAAAHPNHLPAPLTVNEARGPPTGPAANMPDSTRYSGAPTPTSATSTQFNAKAMEFKPNPAAASFTRPGDPSRRSSPGSNIMNGAGQSRVATPSSFFGHRKPLPASERPSILEFFNPIKRLRKEAEQGAEDWSFNGGIRPAHKTAPRWDVAEVNKDKTYTEMFEKVPFSTQAVSPQHPQYAAPQLPHQHQLPFHLQHGGPVVPPPTAPHHQAPHHLHPQAPHHHHHQQQQQQQHGVGLPHHFDDHRVHMSSPSVLPSPRLQPVNIAYHSPMGQHAQVVYGQPMPPYGVGHPGGPQMTPLRQYPPHFVPPHGVHVAPMMTHSPSGGHMAGLPHGMGAPYGPPMPVYSPNPGQYLHHHGGPPPPPGGSTGYPSPGRGAPMMIHQGSQGGHPSHPMMMLGLSPGGPGQHLLVSHPPGHGPPPRGGGYLPPPPPPHYGAATHAHQGGGHPRGGPVYGAPSALPMVPAASHGGGPAVEEEAK
ncbi:MAG: hypothetical protein M1823_001311 [Watsoniomyces obsoletus]|nr:MAG: hypothetical protein M1823_001311 [Watsoniomyces obsoletus]